MPAALLPSDQRSTGRLDHGRSRTGFPCMIEIMLREDFRNVVGMLPGYDATETGRMMTLGEVMLPPEVGTHAPP